MHVPTPTAQEEPNPNRTIGIHFHIRWKESGSLDWEVFFTPQEAKSRAGELARPGEGFAVEQFDKTCPRCGELRKPAK